jgi:hypothetical protein
MVSSACKAEASTLYLSLLCKLCNYLIMTIKISRNMS